MDKRTYPDRDWLTRIMCRLGFHSVFYDTTGRNINPDPDGPPVYFTETVQRCNDCSWQNPRS